MSSLFMLRAGLFTAEVFGGSVLIVCLAWLAAQRGRASERHLVWASSFGALAALPLFIAALPSLLHIQIAASSPLPTQTVVPVASYREAMLPAAAPLAPNLLTLDGESVTRALFLLWLAGAIVVALRFAVSAFCLFLLERKSRTFALLPEDEPKIAATGRECELRLADREVGPATWGISRAVIMLPNSALRWSRERMSAVLLHELAHVRRRDSAIQALAYAACALYWPNPLVWWAAARLRSEAEMAADEAAITDGMKPSSYAGELLSLAQDFASAHANGAALSMAAPSSLKARVKSILAYQPARTAVTPRQVARVVAVGLCIAGAIAVACPSLAQSEGAPPAPAQPATIPAPPQPPSLPSPAMQPSSDIEADKANDAEPALPAEPRQDSFAAPPPAPPAAPADPFAPPAPQAAPSMPAASPDDVDSDIANNGAHVIVDGRNWNELTAAEKKRARAAIARVKKELAQAALQSIQMNAEMQRIQLDKAMAEIRIHRAEIRKVIAQARPQIDEAIAQIHTADIDKALANAHIEEQVRKALEALKRIKTDDTATDNDTAAPDTKVAPSPSEDDDH